MIESRDISVLLAAFNGGRHLKQQLTSLAAQTLRPLEIVITDDGSTDDTVSIIEQFRRETDVPVLLFKGVGGLGASDNFLSSLSRCRGRYIAFCDQDDVWKPRKLQTSRSRLRSDLSLLAIHQSIITDAELNTTGIMTQGIRKNNVTPPGHLDPYLGKFSGWGNTMVFDATLVPLLQSRRPQQPQDSRPLSHDTWTYVLAAALGRVSHIAEPLICYRQHGANIYGVEVEHPWSRMQAAQLSPVDLYKHRRKFYAECVSAFREAQSHALWDVGDLEHAARLYSERASEVALRSEIYTGRTRLGRLRSFFRYYHPGRRRRAFGESSGLSRLRSGAKDLLMGVRLGTGGELPTP